jgi:hypothetical protein
MPDRGFRPIYGPLKPSSLRENYEKKDHGKEGPQSEALSMPYQPPKSKDQQSKSKDPDSPRANSNPPADNDSSEQPEAPIQPSLIRRQTTTYTRTSAKSLPGKTFQSLPKCYAKVLREICPHCFLLENILWRNVQQVESRYESRFRPWKAKNEERACFLQCKLSTSIPK